MTRKTMSNLLIMTRFSLVGAVWLVSKVGLLIPLIQPSIAYFGSLAFPLSQQRRFSTRSTRFAATPTQVVAERQKDDLSPYVQPASSVSSFDDFDYDKHWYPVSFACDLKTDGPNKIALFDVDYAVVLSKDRTSAAALVDQCPHRAALLSEGRITSLGLLQCAYHGWSFEPTTGQCKQVPQQWTATPATLSPRTCAQSVPAVVHQGTVWLWPGPVPNENREVLPTPPTIPELDDPAFQLTRLVRDFPHIDYSILLNNIMDPDHGMFAHQMPSFDFYSASTDNPMLVQEEFPNNGTGWVFTTRVPAKEKLRAWDRQIRIRGEEVQSKKKANLKQQSANITATTVFTAPTTVTMSRYDAANQTRFKSCFFVCPTGTGRSRFMSVSAGKVPFRLPRWFMHWMVNSFLDQDSVLVASQQLPILSKEANLRDQETYSPFSSEERKKLVTAKSSLGVRQALFTYASPTDRSVRRIDQFWDNTLSRAPNRVGTLITMAKAGSFQRLPPREVILDREQDHLKICPDSQKTVQNCLMIRRLSWTVKAGWLIMASVVAKNRWQFVKGTWWMVLVSSMIGSFAEKVRKSFYYSYTERDRDRDLAKIPKKTWIDPQ